MNLGEKIYKLRKEKGLSQEALAEQIGTTRQAVSKWENDQGFPETEKLLQLSNIFEVSTDFLLKNSKLTESNCCLQSFIYKSHHDMLHGCRLMMTFSFTGGEPGFDY